MIDCGFNPGNDKEPSPFLSAPEVTPLEGIDAVVLTHAHLDHSGCVPSLFVSGNCNVYATPPTFELSQLLIEEHQGRISLQNISPSLVLQVANKSVFSTTIRWDRSDID